MLACNGLGVSNSRIASLIDFAEKLWPFFDASSQASEPSDEDALVFRIILGQWRR